MHIMLLCILPGAHKRKEHDVTSILHNRDHGVKSSASECGVMQLDDYHIRLVFCSWVRSGHQEPIRANGLWVPGLGLVILNTPYLVIDTTCFRTCAY